MLVYKRWQDRYLGGRNPAEAIKGEALSFAVFHPGPRNVSTLQGYLKVVEDDSAAQDVVGFRGRRSPPEGGTRRGAEASAAG
jgi:hypothetical protein